MLKRETWEPIPHFASHTFVSSSIFVIVGLPAIGFFLLVELSHKIGVSGFVISVFRVLEYSILTVDAFIFIAFLAHRAWVFIKEIYS